MLFKLITYCMIILDKVLSHLIFQYPVKEDNLMNSYFERVSSNLNHDDLAVLTSNQNDASIKLKAMSKQEVIEESSKAGMTLSEAAIRKALYRLEALMFIEIVPGSRNHKLMITDFGTSALLSQLERIDS